MADGDIVVLADLKVLRFQTGATRKPDSLTIGAIEDQGSRGLFINGRRERQRLCPRPNTT